MKVILSRKGFDSGYGKCPSPILEDGTLLSLPIPAEINDSKAIYYSDLSYNGKTYDEIWKDLCPKHYVPLQKAHLDPDIRHRICKNEMPDWRAVFGQCGAAEGHLENQGIGQGDLFLFFGWFREVINKNGMCCYKTDSPDKLVIFGYLQIGEIVRGDERHKYYWHPHSADYKEKNNTMYVASEEFCIDGKTTGKPGYGTFDYSRKLVLTKDGYSRTRWELPEFFRNVAITYHSCDSFKDDYFQSAKRGQEFVIEENDDVTEWARTLILNN